MPPSIEYSLFVKNDFHIEAYRGKKKIIVRDMLIQNFSFTLSKFSEFDTLVKRLEQTPLDVCCELQSIGQNLLRL